MNKTNIISTIKEAIELRKPIRFDYDKPGKVKGKRVGNPHALFINESTNNTTVDLFQTGGVSDSGLLKPDWKQFLVEYIENIEILKELEQFDIARGYNSLSPRYRQSISKI